MTVAWLFGVAATAYVLGALPPVNVRWRVVFRWPSFAVCASTAQLAAGAALFASLLVHQLPGLLLRSAAYFVLTIIILWQDG